MSANNSRAAFKHMADGTAQDWTIIGGELVAYRTLLADRILTHLKLLDGDFGGFPVDRLTHSLQCATLAEADGRDDEYVLCALLHDIGDTLGSYDHANVAAAILRPFVSEENHWMVQKHNLFQGFYFFEYRGVDPNLRDHFRDHCWYARTIEFCEKYDGAAFDPAYPTQPLAHFEQRLRNMFAKPLHSPYGLALT